MPQLRLITFSDGAGARPGLMLEGGRVLDLAAAGVRFATMQALIEAGPFVVPALRSLAEAPPEAALLDGASVSLLAPIPRPHRNVFCVGRNYMDHVAEGDRAQGKTTSELPKYPQFFTKAPDTVIAPHAEIPSHATVTKYLDYEAELTLIIGTAGRDIARADSLRHIFGYTIANDVTGRDLQRRHGQWFKGKSLDRSCPLGPWIIPAEDLDASDLAIKLWVNGEQRQSSRTSKMIFDIPEIIAQLSQGFTLLPGDVIMTGTPEGVGYAMVPPRILTTGDTVEIEIEGIGRLDNPVGA